MRLKKICDIFDYENVCVCGKRGRGKDLLMSNVVERRKLEYISNVNYGGKHNALDFEKLNVGGNTYENFIENNIFYYEYPYPDKTDIYISDVGIYMPSQYCNELNRKYRQVPTFMALSRHLGACNVHVNVQSLNRAWDKLREQCDKYIHCRKCIYIKKLDIVIQFITIYDQYESALTARKPLKLPMPLFTNKETRMARRIQLAQYEANYGIIQNRILIYKNKSKYDTRAFKEMLKNGKKKTQA